MRRILILKTGETDRGVIRIHGDYDRWFTDAIGPVDGLGFLTIDVRKEPIVVPPSTAGVIVTGATSAAYDPEPWMEPLAGFLANGDASMPPILCVCFGMQLLAAARGGSVKKNPAGWEIGGTTIELTREGAADPLFEGIPLRFEALTTHEDIVEDLPPGVTLLASNSFSRVQAFRAGEKLWGVQFHPEATTPIIERLIRLRADQLARVDEHLESARRPAVKTGQMVLRNFVRACLAW